MTLRSAIEAVALSIVVALSAFGCSSRPARVPAQLEGLGGLIATNSPMRSERREPSLEQGHIEIVYSVIFENIGKDRMDLDLGAATVTVEGTKGNVACDVHGQKMPALALLPSNRWRVDCRLTVAREIVQRGDTEALFEIPVQSGERRGAFRFVYWLIVEDAS